MKKLMPILRLALFCVVLFGATCLVFMLKNGGIFGLSLGKKPGDATAENGKPGEGDEKTMKAGLDGGASGHGGENAGGHEGEEAAPGTAKHAIEPAAKEKALSSGRALFDVPQPISIAEASNLMTELATAKHDYEERKAGLDQREREIEAMSKELEEKRLAILELARNTQSGAPAAAAAAGANESLDTKTLNGLAKVIGNLSPPNLAGKALASYAPEKAALILAHITDDAKVGAILSTIEEKSLTKIIEAIGKLKSSPGEDE